MRRGNVDTKFRNAVLEAVYAIPYGQVMGYKDVACKIGYPTYARHVGFVLSATFDEDVPWWRVIRSDGSIALQGDPIRGPIQIQKLKEEKVPFLGSKVDISKCRYLKE